MKLTKLEGIKFLEELNLPTVERIDINQIVEGQISIDNGISVRVSPKSNNSKWNVYLPSIHGCKNREEVKKFVKDNSQYEIFAHETVKPEVIGSISKLQHTKSIVIETYKNFQQRKEEIIDNRMTIPIFADRLWISHLELLNKNKEDFMNFKKVIIYLKDIPFEQYDLEYIIQNGEVIFTDLTLPDNKEYNSYKKFLLDNKTNLER